MARATGLFHVDVSEVDKLHEKIKLLGDEAENVINETLRSEGAEILAREVTNFIRVSKKNKLHAKQAKWWDTEWSNLSVSIFAAGGAANKPGSWGYLVFPDEGRGPHQPYAQDFSGRGAYRAAPKIVEKLHESLTNKIQEVMSNG